MSENSKHFCMTPHPSGTSLPASQVYSSKAAFLRAALWEPGDTISIRFLGGSQALRGRVRAAAEEWLKHAHIFFSFVEDGSADVRVAFMPGEGSWSYVGTACRRIPATEPTMNFGWLDDASGDEDVRSVVLHEFGHALGLIHEHQNPRDRIRWNRDAVISDLSGPPNNWDEATIEHNMFKAYREDETLASGVDGTSIMMYPIPVTWTEGGYFSAGFNSRLSDTDRTMAREAYPR